MWKKRQDVSCKGNSDGKSGRVAGVLGHDLLHDTNMQGMQWGIGRLIPSNRE